MSENIVWTVEGKINDGKREDFDAVMRAMIEAVQKEEGTLNYEWTLGGDGATLHIYERYKNAEAVSTHLVNSWSKFADRFLAAVQVTRFVVFSNLPPDLKETVAGLNPIYMTPIGGFAK